MSVPENIRTQFSTTNINTGINAKEEINKESAYADTPYIPTQDVRATNPAKVIKDLENASKKIVEDDSTELGELKSAVNKLQEAINTASGNLNTANLSISTLSQDVEAIGPKRVFCVGDIEGISSDTAITTEDLYDCLKTSMSLGDIFVGYINLSDGPTSGDIDIFAYATADNVTDGDSVYSRVYIIASSKATAPYVWWYIGNSWRSMMVLTDYKHFTLQSSTEGSTKKFWISVNDTGTVSATEIVTGA